VQKFKNWKLGWSYFEENLKSFDLIPNSRLGVAYCFCNHQKNKHQENNGKFSNTHSTQTTWG
jgi:hypothetical protein